MAYVSLEECDRRYADHSCVSHMGRGYDGRRDFETYCGICNRWFYWDTGQCIERKTRRPTLTVDTDEFTIEWATGWGPRQLDRYNPDQFRNTGRVVGFKGPSMYVGSTRLYSSLRQNRWISRRKTTDSWRISGLEPIRVGARPCTEYAVHLACDPAHIWVRQVNGALLTNEYDYLHGIFVGVMAASGVHGNGLDEIKWFGLSYRIVAHIDVKDRVGSLTRSRLITALMEDAHATTTSS